MAEHLPDHRARCAASLLLLLALAGHMAGCGGGRDSGDFTAPTAPAAAPAPAPNPTPTPPVGPADACGVIAPRSLPTSPLIVNGSACPPGGASVVLLSLLDRRGQEDGLCTGTVIAERAVLTAAHCLVSPTRGVLVRTDGRSIEAASFSAIPDYDDRDPESLDVGIVIVAEPLGLPAQPLLLGRDARVGEEGIIAGYGVDERGSDGVLRAGPIRIAEVTNRFLIARYEGVGANTCDGDSGGPLLLPEGTGYAIAGVTTGGDEDCSQGLSDFANLRHPSIAAFVLSLVPEAGGR